MNFIKIKKIFLLILSVPVFTLIVYLLISITNRPDIKNITIPDMTDLTFNLDKNFIEDQPKNPENIQAFDYKLIGYRYGESDSSVVVKKGNKEFVVAKGEKLQGIYELVEVSKDEVIFRNNEKLYKIKNIVGK